MTESIPLSPKAALAVVEPDRSHPEYHLYPEWQKYWRTVKYGSFMQNLSLLKKKLEIGGVIPKGGKHFLNFTFRREVTAIKLHRTRLAGEGRVK